MCSCYPLYSHLYVWPFNLLVFFFSQYAQLWQSQLHTATPLCAWCKHGQWGKYIFSAPLPYFKASLTNISWNSPFSCIQTSLWSCRVKKDTCRTHLHLPAYSLLVCLWVYSVPGKLGCMKEKCTETCKHTDSIKLNIFVHMHISNFVCMPLSTISYIKPQICWSGVVWQFQK